ncbi:MAG: cupin domain-containing protein [Deltaproteobacteria bacterium]|nr:cupin domain-containing protein [Deltaproteobacteria bacterium]
MKRLWLVLAACGHSAPPAAPPAPGPAHGSVAAAVTVDAGVSEDEKLAAIQKAMNDLKTAVQQCWASAATERFDIEGDVTAQIEIAADKSKATIVHDTTKSPALTGCLVELLSQWKYAPPLYGQAIQLPFKFSAPDGQSVIDRRLVPFAGQGAVSVAVLLDENNTGNSAVSMLAIKIAGNGTTGARTADRAELWYFQSPAQVDGKPVAAGDMMFVPAHAAREVAASQGPVDAVVVIVPGGREGAARAGALPTPPLVSGGKPARPVMLPASAAKTYGPATIFLDDAKGPLAASILVLPKGAKVPEHVHAKETEALYVLAGAGTMTIAGTDVPITSTSVVQVPANTKHAFSASDDVRALQIYTPPGPEQRFKKK